MFKKKPQIKNLSPLRSSDRRKLADQIVSDYQIPVPQQQPQPTEASESETNAAPQQTLTGLRTSLLPESTSSARFTTTSGANATAVTGTVYVGTHPSQDERILWIQYGKDPKLIPTVYSLWHNPNIVPLLHTADFVVDEKLKAGADLMTPGLYKRQNRKWDQRAAKGSIVAVAGVEKDTVPLWVGVCEIDVKDLGNDLRGTKGAAVRGLHWEGDEIWNWSLVGVGGREAPQEIEKWNGLDGGQDSDLDDDDEDEQVDGGVSLEKSFGDLKVDDANGHVENENTDNTDNTVKNEEEEQEPTTKEIDDAFHQAFLYAAYNAKKQEQPPSYGFDFPIQPSFLIANMIQPHLRFSNQHYTIKKTSWKNVKKFIKSLDKQLLLKSKDRNGGETVILDIDFNDQQITGFTPYKLPKPKPKTTDDANGDSSVSGADGKTDLSLNQTLTIHTLYRASSKLVPDLLPSKTTFYTASQITTALKSYIEANPNLTQSVSISRNIKLDPFIANNILGSNTSSIDQAALRSGEIDRGTLNRRILEDDHLCNPYHVILNSSKPIPSDQISLDPTLKPRPGPPPKITLTIEKRTGTKLVTRISGLEPYHISPQLLAPELQKKCAGSASVGQLVGGKPGMMEITVQGDQRDIVVRDVLGKRGVQGKWVEIIDKGKGKKKK